MKWESAKSPNIICKMLQIVQFFGWSFMSDALNLARPDTSLLRTVARQGGRDVGLERLRTALTKSNQNQTTRDRQKFELCLAKCLRCRYCGPLRRRVRPVASVFSTVCGALPPLLATRTDSR